MSEAVEDTMEIEEDTQKGRFLTFLLDKEVYGIQIKYVTEIIGIQPITEMPESPDYLKGIINLRGKIIPVMDVRMRFKKDLKSYNDRTCIIVIHVKDVTIGLIVDTVSEVINISEADIISPPKINKEVNSRYIENIGRVGSDIKLLIDCEKLLTEDEIENLSEIL